jgi:post-segregation antitoxin (ccd killing protein)
MTGFITAHSPCVFVGEQPVTRKANTTVTADPELLDRAEEAGLNRSKIFREALRRELN